MPFLVEEMLATLVASGARRRAGATWTLGCRQLGQLLDDVSDGVDEVDVGSGCSAPRSRMPQCWPDA